MKPLLTLLLTLCVSNSLFAQSSLFFSIPELKELLLCPNHECFRKIVNAKGYQYSKTEESVVREIPQTTYIYWILSTGQQPYRPEYIVSYTEGKAGRTIGFLTKNADFPTWLDREIPMNNFVRLPDQNHDDGHQNYILDGPGYAWNLRRNKPGKSQGQPTYSISLLRYYKPKTTPAIADQPAKPVAPAPANSTPETSEMPHLGGQWDTKYPIQNVANVLQTERQYAADYERKNGKVGHTFFRVEKMRITGRYLNQYRPLPLDRWSKSFDLALRQANYEAFANDYPRLYQQEVLFEVGGERVWMPIQQPVSEFLRKENPTGPLTLYALLVSYHDYSGTLHLSFLVNEFATGKEDKGAQQPIAKPYSPNGSVDSQPIHKQDEPLQMSMDSTGLNLDTSTIPPESSSRTTAPKPSAMASVGLSQSENFKTFIQRFSTDKTFQLSRVKFPIVWEAYENGETLPRRDTKTTWKHLNVLKAGGPDMKVFVAYPTPQKPNEAGVSETCYPDACGLSFGLGFKRVNGLWYCVSRFLNSD